MWAFCLFDWLFSWFWWVFCWGFLWFIFFLQAIGVLHSTSEGSIEWWSRTAKWVMFYTGKGWLKVSIWVNRDTSPHFLWCEKWPQTNHFPVLSLLLLQQWNIVLHLIYKALHGGQVCYKNLKYDRMSKPTNINTGNGIEILYPFFFFVFLNDVWDNDYKISCLLSWHFCMKWWRALPLEFLLFQVFQQGIDWQITDIHLKSYKTQELQIR